MLPGETYYPILDDHLPARQGRTAMKIENIQVTVHEPDLRDWIAAGLVDYGEDETDEWWEERLAEYCRAYEELIEWAYPEAETVEVFWAETNGYKVVEVNDEMFGRGQGYGDRGTRGLGKIAEEIATLEDRVPDQLADGWPR